MKTPTTISLLIGLLAPLALAQGTPNPRIRDAATHEHLASAYQQARQQDPMARLKQSTGEDPSIVNLPEDLMANSDILCFGGSATLVPKRAILNMPEKLKERLKFVPGSSITSWAQFYSVNRGWITTVEVSRAQAEGNSALQEETAERIGKSANLVVAVYKGGPISVLPPKVTEENLTINP
jgi:hypothetical protein